MGGCWGAPLAGLCHGAKQGSVATAAGRPSAACSVADTRWSPTSRPLPPRQLMRAKHGCLPAEVQDVLFVLERQELVMMEAGTVYLCA